MKKVFIAIDTTDLKKAQKIIAQSQTNKIKVGYKFGLEFLYTKNGRNFVSKIKGKNIILNKNSYFRSKLKFLSLRML